MHAVWWLAKAFLRLSTGACTYICAGAGVCPEEFGTDAPVPAELLIWEVTRGVLAEIGDWGSRPLDEVMTRLRARGCRADEAAVVAVRSNPPRGAPRATWRHKV